MVPRRVAQLLDDMQLFVVDVQAAWPLLEAERFADSQPGTGPEPHQGAVAVLEVAVGVVLSHDLARLELEQPHDL